MRILMLACAVMAMGGTAGAQGVAAIDCRGASIAECHKGRSESTPLFDTKEYGPAVLTFDQVPIAVTSCAEGTSGCAVISGDRSWHFVSQTYGGHVSALGNLTKEECDGMVKRSRNEPSTEEEIRGAAYLAAKHKGETCVWLSGAHACMPPHMLTSSDVRDAECYQ